MIVTFYTYCVSSCSSFWLMLFEVYTEWNAWNIFFFLWCHRSMKLKYYQSLVHHFIHIRVKFSLTRFETSGSHLEFETRFCGVKQCRAARRECELGGPSAGQWWLKLTPIEISLSNIDLLYLINGMTGPKLKPSVVLCVSHSVWSRALSGRNTLKV